MKLWMLLLILLATPLAFADCVTTYDSCTASCCTNVDGQVDYSSGSPTCSGYGAVSKDNYDTCISMECVSPLLTCVGSYSCAAKHSSCQNSCTGAPGSGVGDCYATCDSEGAQCAIDEMDSGNNNPPSPCCNGIMLVGAIPLLFLLGLHINNKR